MFNLDKILADSPELMKRVKKMLAANPGWKERFESGEWKMIKIRDDETNLEKAIVIRRAKCTSEERDLGRRNWCGNCPGGGCVVCDRDDSDPIPDITECACGHTY